MAKATLRINQYDTVHFDTNVNPLGIPETVRTALANSISSVYNYPESYYNNLRTAISEYSEAPTDRVILGSGSVDLIQLFTSHIKPKKALVIVPGSMGYEKVLKANGCEMDYYHLDESNDYEPDIKDFIAKLNDSYDMLIIGNPNNPTSKKMERSAVEEIAKACDSHGIFLVIDEMYIEFIDNEKDYTAIPLTEKYKRLAVLRSVTKFFAVPGLRMAYAIMNNPEQLHFAKMTSSESGISSLTAIACSVMFRDKAYIEESKSMMHTERSLVYLAMSTCKTIKLIKPDANFMLMKILKDDLFANDIYEHCKQRGVIIRKCDDITGLSNKYVRFCFMNPKQNDLMVNTILELM
ncbi:threonine-phosphate decarboxylase [Eubacterium ruminantium]|nr:threonine-phosphate decarboxylase [Eubacterium ruminantium]